MGPGRKPKNATDRRPVLVSWQLAVNGGHLKAPAVVGTKTVQHQGRDVSFVSVSAVTPWLCEMVAGQCASKRSLARCSITGQLRKLMVEDAPELPVASTNDKMAALFDEGEEAEKVATPKVKKPRGPAVLSFEDTVVKVRVPASAVFAEAAPVDAEQAASAEPERAAFAEAKRAAPAEAETRSLLMLRCSDMAPRIEIDALAWLVTVLQDERQARGIPSMKPRAENHKGDIWWDFTNDIWRCRSYNEKGEVEMHSKGVRPRVLKDLKGFSFAEAKSLVYEEMVLWRVGQNGGVAASGS